MLMQTLIVVLGGLAVVAAVVGVRLALLRGLAKRHAAAVGALSAALDAEEDHYPTLAAALVQKGLSPRPLTPGSTPADRDALLARLLVVTRQQLSESGLAHDPAVATLLKEQTQRRDAAHVARRRVNHLAAEHRVAAEGLGRLAGAPLPYLLIPTGE
jgi:hypothetical protein